jgi:glucose/arabinose dehydrogenase
VDKFKARAEIWAYGLRNPWRFSFDPVEGTLYAADVGQSAREEINVIEAGKNYGWNIMEGSICTPGLSSNCATTGLTLPIAEYTRDKGISVIGGFVYRGSKIPDLCGAYLYGDFGSGRIWALQYQNFKVKRKKLLIDTNYSISSFGTDEDFEIYMVDYSGSIYKLDL